MKKDHSRSGLGSPEVEGQGTTTHETGSHKVPSSNKKQKRSQHKKGESWRLSFFHVLHLLIVNFFCNLIYVFA